MKRTIAAIALLVAVCIIDLSVPEATRQQVSGYIATMFPFIAFYLACCAYEQIAGQLNRINQRLDDLDR